MGFRSLPSLCSGSSRQGSNGPCWPTVAGVHRASAVKAGALVSCYGGMRFLCGARPGVGRVVPDKLSGYPGDAFSVDIPVCPPAGVASFIAAAIGFDIPYRAPDSVGALFSSGSRFLYWAGNHIGAVGLTVSWGWGLASLPSLDSLAWNCALGVGWLAPSPGIGVGVGARASCSVH